MVFRPNFVFERREVVLKEMKERHRKEVEDAENQYFAKIQDLEKKMEQRQEYREVFNTIKSQELDDQIVKTQALTQRPFP